MTNTSVENVFDHIPITEVLRLIGGGGALGADGRVKNRSRCEQKTKGTNAMTKAPTQDVSGLISVAEVLRLIGRRSRTTLYVLMRRYPDFPRPVRGTSDLSIAWQRNEVIKWVEGRPRIALTGVSVFETRQAMSAGRIAHG